MNISTFLERWSLAENPFAAEEARHDSVFARLTSGATTHPDFEKIVGDLFRPSTAIVFGEKGSGKTAIRLQLADRIQRHNNASPAAKVLLVAHDDLNPALDHFLGQRQRKRPTAAQPDPSEAFRALRLVDHMDAILAAAVQKIIDMLLAPAGADEPWKALRAQGPEPKRSALLLQALYDRHDGAELRRAELKRRLKPPIVRKRLLWKSLALGGALLPILVAIGSFTVPRDIIGVRAWFYLLYAALGVWAFFLVKWFLWDQWLLRLKASRVARRLRTVPRSVDALAAALGHLEPAEVSTDTLPTDDTDEKRYALFARLRRLLSALGYSGMIVVIDRVDEPTSISGDVERMRAVVWPLLNNKFLQQDGIGFKLLLPVELRHELFRESSAFFQEARLDKQNMVERLTWTGPSLYDLCNARLRACRAPDAPGPITLSDLFEDDVQKQDIVDALDQMRQPRDAFKLLYQCIQEHCSNVTEDQNRTRIPKLVLDTVRKQQADRVQMLQRGYRPA